MFARRPSTSIPVFPVLFLPSRSPNQVSEMKAVEQRKTPLQVSMDDLGQRLSVMSFAVIGCIALVGASFVVWCICGVQCIHSSVTVVADHSYGSTISGIPFNV